MAMSRSVVRVVPRGSGWAVTKSNRTVSNHRKKDNAIESGRRAAMKQRPSQLVVLKANGEIETEYTYERDPHPPKG